LEVKVLKLLLLTKNNHPRMIVAVRRLQEQQQHGISSNTGTHFTLNPMAVVDTDHLDTADRNEVLFSMNSGGGGGGNAPKYYKKFLFCNIV
jgi:hypothetical protein